MSRTMNLYGVKHQLVQAYHFNALNAVEKVENQHPLGDIYLDGGRHYGYVQSGYDWLRFPMDKLPKIVRKARDQNRRDVAAEHDRQNALKSLRTLLQPGEAVYTLVRWRARNGIGVVVAVLVIDGNRIKNISGTVATALGYDWHDTDGIKTASPFDVVMNLSYALHGYENVDCEGVDANPQPNPKRYRAGYSLLTFAL